MISTSPEMMIAGGISLAALIIAAINDLRTREVPDWLNYALIAFGLGMGAFFSLLSWSYLPFLASALGFLLCAGIGFLMYYAGQWGGGDAKLLMGIGAVVGLPLADILQISLAHLPFLVLFFIYILLAGAAYGLVWTAVLAVRRRDVFLPAARSLLQAKPVRIGRILVAIMALAFFAIAILTSGVTRLAAFSCGIVIYAFFYLWVFVRAIERSCMEKDIPPEKLTEGDWILRDIVIDGKRIAGPKDLGISKAQIAELILLKKKKKLTTVAIKEGVPFVPSFLIGFLLTVAFPSRLSFLAG